MTDFAGTWQTTYMQEDTSDSWETLCMFHFLFYFLLLKIVKTEETNGIFDRSNTSGYEEKKNSIIGASNDFYCVC